MGVRQFSVPARELSISSSAMQNKYAGIMLPSAPEQKTITSFVKEIVRICLTATGNSTTPAAIMRREATWYEERLLLNPIFIRIKLLPQITDNRQNKNQCRK